MGVAEGGFPYSHITLSQNVHILVKTKNAPKTLKRKININFFCDMGVPKLGEGGEVCPLGNFADLIPFIFLKASITNYST